MNRNVISLKLIIFFCFFFVHLNRGVLCKAKELGVRTIGLCVVSCNQRNFPPDLGAHIALSKLMI